MSFDTIGKIVHSLVRCFNVVMDPVLILWGAFALRVPANIEADEIGPDSCSV